MPTDGMAATSPSACPVDISMPTRETRICTAYLPMADALHDENTKQRTDATVLSTNDTPVAGGPDVRIPKDS